MNERVEKSTVLFFSFSSVLFCSATRPCGLIPVPFSFFLCGAGRHIVAGVVTTHTHTHKESQEDTRSSWMIKCLPIYHRPRLHRRLKSISRALKFCSVWPLSTGQKKTGGSQLSSSSGSSAPSSFLISYQICAPLHTVHSVH